MSWVKGFCHNEQQEKLPKIAKIGSLSLFSRPTKRILITFPNNRVQRSYRLSLLVVLTLMVPTLMGSALLMVSTRTTLMVSITSLIRAMDPRCQMLLTTNLESYALVS